MNVKHTYRTKIACIILTFFLFTTVNMSFAYQNYKEYDETNNLNILNLNEEITLENEQYLTNAWISLSDKEEAKSTSDSEIENLKEIELLVSTSMEEIDNIEHMVLKGSFTLYDNDFKFHETLQLDFFEHENNSIYRATGEVILTSKKTNKQVNGAVLYNAKTDNLFLQFNTGSPEKGVGRIAFGDMDAEMIEYQINRFKKMEKNVAEDKNSFSEEASPVDILAEPGPNSIHYFRGIDHTYELGENVISLASFSQPVSERSSQAATVRAWAYPNNVKSLYENMGFNVHNVYVIGLNKGIELGAYAGVMTRIDEDVRPLDGTGSRSINFSVPISYKGITLTAIDVNITTHMGINVTTYKKSGYSSPEKNSARWEYFDAAGGLTPQNGTYEYTGDARNNGFTGIVTIYNESASIAERYFAELTYEIQTGTYTSDFYTTQTATYNYHND